MIRRMLWFLCGRCLAAHAGSNAHMAPGLTISIQLFESGTKLFVLNSQMHHTGRKIHFGQVRGWRLHGAHSGIGRSDRSLSRSGSMVGDQVTMPW